MQFVSASNVALGRRFDGQLKGRIPTSSFVLMFVGFDQRHAIFKGIDVQVRRMRNG
jgi:hypothetical protein